MKIYFLLIKSILDLLDEMEKVKRENLVSNTQIKNFMQDILEFIIAMLEKIFEKKYTMFFFIQSCQHI